MTEQQIWVVNWVSTDGRDLGTGVVLFWTEAEALNAVRASVTDNLDGRWDDSEYPDQATADAAYAAAVAAIQKMTLSELQEAYSDDASDQYIQEVHVYPVKLTAIPDVSTPDKIEQFLGRS